MTGNDMAGAISAERLHMAQYPKNEDKFIISREALGQLIDVGLYAWKQADKNKHEEMSDKSHACLSAVRAALGRPEFEEEQWDEDDESMDWEDEDIVVDDDEPWDDDDDDDMTEDEEDVSWE